MFKELSCSQGGPITVGTGGKMIAIATNSDPAWATPGEVRELITLLQNAIQAAERPRPTRAPKMPGKGRTKIKVVPPGEST